MAVKKQKPLKCNHHLQDDKVDITNTHTTPSVSLSLSLSSPENKQNQKKRETILYMESVIGKQLNGHTERKREPNSIVQKATIE